MSFSAFARRVRDPALPYQRRVSALRSCVQLYRPVGFEATLSFLEELAGPFRRDEAALLRALEHLAASRRLRHEDLQRYAAERRTAKQLGRRTPGRADRNPNLGPPIWYGAAQRAALHALSYWRRSRLPELLAGNDPGAREIGSSVSACLASGGPLTVEQQRRLDDAVQQVRQRADGRLHDEDAPAYFRARDLLCVAALVRDAATPECAYAAPRAGGENGGPQGIAAENEGVKHA